MSDPLTLGGAAIIFVTVGTLGLWDNRAGWTGLGAFGMVIGLAYAVGWLP